MGVTSLALGLLMGCSMVRALAVQGIEEDTPCVPLDECSKCSIDQRCGWCAALDSCFEGDMEGPWVGNCSSWSFGFCSGEACMAYKDCNACANDPFCGWCQETLQCMEGSTEGPLLSECKGSWAFGNCLFDPLKTGVPVPVAQKPFWHQAFDPRKVIIDVESKANHDSNVEVVDHAPVPLPEEEPMFDEAAAPAQ